MLFGLADGEEQLVATQFLFALLELFEPPDQLAQFAQTDFALFFQSILTLDKDVKFLILGQEFDAHLRARLLPGQLQQLLLQFAQASFGCAHQIGNRRIGAAHFFQYRFGGNTSIHHPDALSLAV